MGDLRSGALDAQAKRGEDGNIIEQLRDIRLRLEERQSLTDDQSSLLADGLGRYLDALDDGNAPYLDMTLGLKSWGGISPRHGERLAWRDELLLRLWKTCPDFIGLPSISAAKLMSLSATRYASARWAREKKERISGQSEPAATWWKIMKSGLDVPGSKRLQQILDQDQQSFVGIKK